MDATSHCLPEEKDQSQFDLSQDPIPLFVNQSGIFNRVENPPKPQPYIITESTQAIEDEASQTWEVLGNVNFS